MHQGTSSAQREYEIDLRALRRGVGCTSGRLTQSTGLCAAITRRSGNHLQETSPEVLLEELRSLVESLDEPKLRGSLLVALGLEPLFRQYSLSERRKNYARSLAASPDPKLKSLAVDNLRTLERRENRAIEQVARLLTFEAPPLPPERPPDAPLGPLVKEAISYHCWFSDTGVLTTQDTTWWLRATSSPSEQEFEISHNYVADRESGHLRVESLFGCSVVEHQEVAGGRLWARLRIHRELTPEDGLYSLGYRLHVDSSEASYPYVYNTVRTEHLSKIEFHLTFSENFRPDRAWWFRSNLSGRGEIEPSSDTGRHLEKHHEGSYLYRIFEKPDIIPHMDHGISWAWESRERS